MSETPSASTIINFRGLQLVLPASLPFSHTADGTLTLDCTSGFHGKLQLRPTLQEEPVGIEGITTKYGNAIAPLSGEETAQPSVAAPARRIGGKAVPTDTVIPDSQTISLAGLSWIYQPPAASEFPQQSPEDDIADGAGTNKGLDSAKELPSQGIATGLSRSEPDKEQQQNPGTAEKGGAPASAIPDDLSRRCAMDAIADIHQKPQAEQRSLPEARSPQKENTPAAANQARPKPKRRSEGSSTGKRKKLRGTGGSPLLEMKFGWKPLECETSGEMGPLERWGASFTSLGGSRVCLFAGNSTDEQLGDTWILDVAGPSWQRAGVPDVAGKAWHSAQLVISKEGQHLYTFGGERVPPSASNLEEEEEDEDDGGECLSEVCQLDLDAKMWVQLPISDGMSGAGKVGQILPPGERLERSGHTTTLLPDGRILLFGGIDNTGRYCNDAHIIAPDILNCFSLSGSIVKGAPPKPRAYHTATLVGNSVVVIGGRGVRPWSLKEVYSLSMENWQWKEHTSIVEGEAPTPRSGHSAVALPGGRFLLVFGGGIPENDTFYSTVAVLDTHSWTWFTPLLEGVERPCGRSGHGMALVQLTGDRSALVMYGGRAHDETLCKDTWLLEMCQ